MNPVFIHIPKSAGTSIRAALDITHYDEDARTSHVPWSHPTMSAWYESTPEPYLFACVRHPCDRAVSIHGQFARRMRRENGVNVVLEELCRQLDVNEFWTRCDIERLQLHVPHLRSQHSFLEGAPCEMLLRFEQLASDWVKLTDAIGRPGLQLSHHRRSEHAKWQDLLSPRAARKIHALFEDDFNTYGYDLS